MLSGILAIVAGLLLLRNMLRGGAGAWVQRTTQVLLPLEAAIGIAALIVGLLKLLSLEGVLLILAGLILAVNVLRALPEVGPSLGRLGNALDAYRLIVGALVLLVGLLNIVNQVFRL